MKGTHFIVVHFDIGIRMVTTTLMKTKNTSLPHVPLQSVPHPHSRQSTIYFLPLEVCVVCFRISRKWKDIVCTLLWLASYTQRDVHEVHLCYCGSSSVFSLLQSGIPLSEYTSICLLILLMDGDFGHLSFPFCKMGGTCIDLLGLL